MTSETAIFVLASKLLLSRHMALSTAEISLKHCVGTITSIGDMKDAWLLKDEIAFKISVILTLFCP